MIFQSVYLSISISAYLRSCMRAVQAFVIKLTMLPSPAALPLPQSLRRTEFWQHTEHFGLEELCMGIFTRVTSMCRRRKVLFYDFGLCKCNATEEEIQRDMHAVHELLSQGH